DILSFAAGTASAAGFLRPVASRLQIGGPGADSVPAALKNETDSSLSAPRPIDPRVSATGTEPSWPCVPQAQNLGGLVYLKAQTDLAWCATRLERPSFLRATG